MLPYRGVCRSETEGAACSFFLLPKLICGRFFILLVRVWWNGRHARFRFWYREVCKFKSCHPHHKDFLDLCWCLIKPAQASKWRRYTVISYRMATAFFRPTSKAILLYSRSTKPHLPKMGSTPLSLFCWTTFLPFCVSACLNSSKLLQYRPAGCIFTALPRSIASPVAMKLSRASSIFLIPGVDSPLCTLRSDCGLRGNHSLHYCGPAANIDPEQASWLSHLVRNIK